MDDEDFLAAVEADNANAPVEDQPEPETVKEEPILELTDPLPAEPAQAPAVEAAPIEQPKPEPVMVPLAALHETRDEVKALKAQLEALQPRQQQPQVQAPDPYEDPEGFAAFQQANVSTAILNTKLDVSEEMARAAHGDEIVDQVQKWAAEQFQKNPSFQAELFRQRNPYGYAIKQYKAQQALERLGSPDDIDGYLAWKAAQGQLQQQQGGQPPPPPNQTSAIPPRSLASAPSAGGILSDAVQSDAEMFEEVIPKG